MMSPEVLGLAVALGIGLLVGAERERRKGDGPSRASAGIRTFAVASLCGAASVMVAGSIGLAVTVAGVAGLAALGYWRNKSADPGLTTEVALVLITLLGGLCVVHAALAAAAAAALAALLATRTSLHRFVRSVITEAEARSALIFAIATLVVLPLLPDRRMGPYMALNPHSIWILVVLVLGIGAVGHIAVRMLGRRFGLPVAGLASGFASSIATIGAMGAQARRAPLLSSGAVAGAVLSTVATVAQMAVVVAATSLPTLRAIAAPLICAAVAASLYGAVFTVAAIRQTGEPESEGGQAFSLSHALVFALILAVVLVVAAALGSVSGQAGAFAAAAVAGFADTHAAAISIASLVEGGGLTPAQAVAPILGGFTANTVSKMIVAGTSGGRPFALRVAPGLVLVALAAWAGTLIRV